MALFKNLVSSIKKIIKKTKKKGLSLKKSKRKNPKRKIKKKTVKKKATKKKVVKKKGIKKSVNKKKAVKKKITKKKQTNKKLTKKKVTKKKLIKNKAPVKKVLKKKKSAQKSTKKKIPRKAKKLLKQKPPKEVLGKPLGEITHYFNKIKVVVIDLKKDSLSVGDTIRIHGSVDFKQKVSSMQIESVDMKAAKKGSLIGMKIKKKAREGDLVYKV